MFSNLLRFSLNAYTELAEAEKIDEGVLLTARYGPLSFNCFSKSA